MKQIKVGDIVTPKEFPLLKGEVISTGTFMEDKVYVLDTGGSYTKDELN